MDCAQMLYQERVSEYYSGLMSDDPHCPIRLQSLASVEEVDPVLPEWAQEMSFEAFGRNKPWHADSIGDLENLGAPRITHRYRSRAILHVSPICATYCRFCFRKSHLNTREKEMYAGDFKPALEYLASHSEIEEVILTGGDPLSLSNTALEQLFGQLSLCAVKSIRIHSRMSVTQPSRITKAFSEVLERFRKSSNKHIAFVSHFNHPKEWTTSAQGALQLLHDAGIDLYNQSVLLRKVNDSTDALAELFQSLYYAGVRPMYLHHPDWTPGTFHFRVPIEKGRALMRELAGQIPGAAIPHYVLDLSRGLGKVNLLDEKVVERLSLREDREMRMGGALYRVRPSWTRSTESGAKMADEGTRFSIPSALYAELYPLQ